MALLFVLALPWVSALADPLADPQAAGVPNFRQVSERVYRGAQPTAEGFKSLAKLGVKTVVDLRESDGRSRTEQRIVEALGMRYISVPMKGLQAPTDEQISKILTILDDIAAGPVFVHCKRGVDRTGTVIACYRIARERWQNEKALEEAKSIGMHWVEFAMRRYILQYQTAGRVPTPSAGAATAGVSQ